MALIPDKLRWQLRQSGDEVWLRAVAYGALAVVTALAAALPRRFIPGDLTDLTNRQRGRIVAVDHRLVEAGGDDILAVDPGAGFCPGLGRDDAARDRTADRRPADATGAGHLYRRLHLQPCGDHRAEGGLLRRRAGGLCAACRCRAGCGSWRDLLPWGLPGRFPHLAYPPLWATGLPEDEGCAQDLADEAQATFSIGAGRSCPQDPRFGLIAPPRVAQPALSPGISLVRLMGDWCALDSRSADADA